MTRPPVEVADILRAQGSTFVHHHRIGFQRLKVIRAITESFLDLNEAETADVLGLPRGTVKSRLSRALGRLRDRLSATTEGPNRG